MRSAWEKAAGVCMLVTVVGTRGSSYRSPGARMLILPDGSRIGAVSGGCLEGELCRRALWWTASSPAVLKVFDTSAQEDSEGFGLGCGGGIDLLLERLPAPAEAGAAHPLLAQEQVNRSREPSAQAVVVHTAESSGPRVGERFTRETVQAYPEIQSLLDQCMRIGDSFTRELREPPLAGCRIFVERLVPPVQLLVCGAGADAQPLVALAAALGWEVIVMDGRADFARAARFPDAARVLVAKEAAALEEVRIDARTAAIVMSHSFRQDTLFLDALLSRQPGYLGVLGARSRTLDLLARLGRDAIPAALHAPAGLDIGAETPEQIALSILSEIQAAIAGRPGSALRERNGSIHSREHDPDGRPSARKQPLPTRTKECGLL